jgi:hypothetical protein
LDDDVRVIRVVDHNGNDLVDDDDDDSDSLPGPAFAESLVQAPRRLAFAPPNPPSLPPSQQAVTAAAAGILGLQRNHDKCEMTTMVMNHLATAPAEPKIDTLECLLLNFRKEHHLS